MESVGVAPAPVAVAVAEQKMKLLEPRKEPLASAAAAAKAPCKWAMKKKLVGGDAGYVLEDVPHLTDYMPELPVRAIAPVLLSPSPVPIAWCSCLLDFPSRGSARSCQVSMLSRPPFLAPFCGFSASLYFSRFSLDSRIN